MTIEYYYKPAIVLETAISPTDNRCLIHKVFWDNEVFALGETLDEDYRYQRLSGEFEDYKSGKFIWGISKTKLFNVKNI